MIGDEQLYTPFWRWLIPELFSQFRQSTKAAAIWLLLGIMVILLYKTGHTPETAFEAVKWLGGVAIGAVIGFLFDRSE